MAFKLSCFISRREFEEMSNADQNAFLDKAEKIASTLRRIANDAAVKARFLRRSKDDAFIIENQKKYVHEVALLLQKFKREEEQEKRMEFAKKYGYFPDGEFTWKC
jgi:hypothetical protein